MKKMSITITDYHNLIGLLEMALLKNKVSELLQGLRNDLRNAKRISQVNIPKTIVTMNSRVMLFDPQTGRQVILTLTYPHNADLEKKKISVFSPLGVALLGATEGETITWEVPSGTSHLIIKKVLYQPEAEGHYHL
jgi:regulator of nucleoside diphosphate kinase